MGKLLTFASPLHGQCKTTASMVAVAMGARLKNCIFVHTQTMFADLENMFNARIKDSDDLYSKIGINNLCYEMKAHELTKEDIIKNTVELSEDFRLLPSSIRYNTDEDREQILLYIITVELPKYFDNVCVDLGSGNSALIKAVQQKATKNYLVLAQNKPLYKKYDDINNLNIVLGGYDRNRKLSVSNAKGFFRCPVYTVPYCPEYADAISAGKVAQFFATNEKLIDRNKLFKTDSLYAFFNGLPKTLD